MYTTQIPGMRRWKKNRKQMFLILFSMSLCFLLIGFTFLFGDSFEKTMQERRWNAYGEWQMAFKNIAEADEERVRALPLLERAGTIWTAGDIGNEEVKNA